MSDDYEHVSRSSLKLKLPDGMVKKKKKKDKQKNKEKAMRMMEQVGGSSGGTDADKESGSDSLGVKSTAKEGVKLTKAQLAFKKMQEKKQIERIMEKASKSHKQRVEEFNSHLDELSEHYDIPKVSWTK